MNIKQEIMHTFQRHKAIQDHAGIVISPKLHRSDLLVVQHKLLQPGTDYDETFWDDRSGVAENTVELTTSLKICITCLQSIARNTTQATTEKAVFTYETLATLMNVNHRGLHNALNRLKVSGFCGIQPTGWRSSFQVTGVLSLPGAKENGLLRNVIARPLTKKEVEQCNHKGELVLMRCVLDKRIWQQRFTKSVGALADTTGPKAITVEEHQKHEKHFDY
ncbi:hypothetical protein QWR64_003983 [Escherichia coli]|nr:hypothetical protein [Escherichia coli]